MAGTVNHSRIKVAVIGAGAAGLCAGRHLISEPEKFQFDIFEQQDDVGGTWRYSPRVGSDEYGLPVHSSMYKNLKTNLPKEVMAFPDFPFPDCDGQSFLHHTVVLQYLEEYAKQYGLYTHIKFHTLVENVEPVEHSNDKVEWIVDIQDVASNERARFVYDAVMVCNGHYSVPYIPEIPGLDTFDGLLMHSHDYREESKFQNLKVVVLGAGASGIDIAIEISKVAAEVVLSHNTPPKTSRLLPNMTQEKGIESVQKSSVTFIGGKKYQCDAILICTGYLYTYPFFHPKCKIEIGDQKVSPLYLHLFHIDYPTLAIWAVPKLIIPFPIYDQQVKVFLKFLKGIVKLPSKEEMRGDAERDFLKRLESGFKPRHAHVMPGDFQWEYDDKLSELGKIKPIPDAVRNLFKHVHFTRTQDVLNYKNVNYSILDEKTFLEIE
ncbi:Flavin-containing monooxygenase FMO GS-OX-like 2, partial [Stegodyphus mimosarum]